MSYEMQIEDIVLANAQLQSLNGDAGIWDIFTNFDEKQYRVLHLKYIKARKKVKLSLVRAC